MDERGLLLINKSFLLFSLRDVDSFEKVCPGIPESIFSGLTCAYTSKEACIQLFFSYF
ncbi:hypothetical protein NIES267_61310 [Calothrix parasitica NIES-267]|uniref:Uncharacterized protein n=1 Tax=Calothrix parasitica NIES-267 TaxID=1973488 RepID=A0A1Z4LZH5_9CYAN|nr:hypothetical protein NIES267_61310 [Calothrix parasitica NIES-267]